MKIVMCVHGYPPELWGGTEASAQALALGFAEAGHQVIVVAGSWKSANPPELAIRVDDVEVQGAGSLRVERWTRPDLYFDHWHKSRSVHVARAFRDLLRREQPDVVHVMHWLRLTRGLVAIAAEEEVPAVVSLHDSWVSCPLTFRVRPQTGAICETPLSGSACLTCAAQVAPRTPWVALETAHMEFASRNGDLARELRWARACIVPTDSFGKWQQALTSGALEFDFEVLAPRGVSAVFVAARKRRVPTPGQLRIGAWGQISPLKGIDLLFEAISCLEEAQRIELVLAGNETEPGWLAALIQRFPNVRVTCHGPYALDELPGHPVTQVDLMVSASRAPESFGLVLEEARALGLPSVLPRSGAFAERVGEKEGSLLFEPGDASSLGKALGKLLAEESLLSTMRTELAPALKQAQVVQDHLGLYARVLAAGNLPKVAPAEWYADRMALFAEEEWDRALSLCSPNELGLQPACTSVEPHEDE